jgi:hypothetical protein
MLPTLADTATAPRIRQYEQVQRRAVLNPSVNFHSEAHGTAVACRFHFPCFMRLHGQAPDPALARLLTINGTLTHRGGGETASCNAAKFRYRGQLGVKSGAGNRGDWSSYVQFVFQS